MVESKPGEVAEVDFGRLGIINDPASGRNRVLYALVVTLLFSRYQYVYTTRSLVQSTSSEPLAESSKDLLEKNLLPDLNRISVSLWS